ncbi:MAG: iron-containing alcohol dehydrogenase family protein [Lachnospiraceae bacterium]|nr:iron-containing alcohol dehydrogenase family protein [Lachnospiraceae bacterium]
MAEIKSIYLPRFTIGEDAFDLFQSEMEKYGKNIVVIHGEKAWNASGKYVLPAIEKAGLNLLDTVLYGHEATYENLDKITANENVQKADMILGVGGGKCLDTVKLAADKLGKPVFTVPSIASNCAPVTKISIMYHADGSFCDIPVLKQAPIHCFINPRIIMAAPDRFLIAGIGDAMAKHVESSWSAKAGEKLDYGSEFGITAGRMCFYPFLNDAEPAVEDFKKGIVSEALENSLLNVIVSPGIVSVSVHPYYNGGIAHSLFYGLTSRSHIEKNHLHGEVVSYGTLVSLMADQDYDKLKPTWELNKAIGLPTCLADLELEKEDPLEDVLKLTLANQELVHTPYPVDAKLLREAILKLEDYRG